MLAGRRVIRLPDQEIRTPLLVPSFSSKSDTDWELRDEVELMAEHIASPVLMSAYDLHYGHVDPPSFPSLLFLDSGGYEANRDVIAAERRGDKSMLERQPWTPELYEGVLRGLQCASPVVAVSYDHPNLRMSIDRQIENALALPTGAMLKELLLKPEVGGECLPINAIVERAAALAAFEVIGVTDKELGRSMRDRLIAVARIRKGLAAAGLDTPIHVFGSLDPLTTPLYFLAGADVFDGLAWLRYAVSESGTSYLQNYGVLECGLNLPIESIQALAWQRNFVFLTKLEARMRSFLKSQDFDLFAPHQALFREASGIVEEEVEG